MRSFALGNGSLLVTLDRHAQVRDLYFPRVGLENHVGGELRHRIGVYCDGGFSWFDDGQWDISVECAEDTLASCISATHAGLGVSLKFRDIVYNESDVFLRRIVVKNLAEHEREIKVYFGHEFETRRSVGGDTAYVDPMLDAIIHYEGDRVCLINGSFDGESISDYAIGISRTIGHDGAYRDAEDGSLSKNPIEHGTVDSVIGFYGTYSSGGERTIRYWLVAADSIGHAIELNLYVSKKGPDHLIKTASDYWRVWIARYSWQWNDLTPQMISLFKQSLMYVRAHVDNGGGIIASSDAQTLQYGEDTYIYVWPRDAAYAALALDRAGETNVAERFFTFCNTTLNNSGYFMHKYLTDQSLGSSWHPWIKDGVVQLPIQEDQTAIVLWALREHYQHSHDIEFIESIYNSLIVRAADFMSAYRDPATNLPKPSYDLWEEHRGVSTYTASAVFGALNAAADFAKLLGKTGHEQNYRTVAAEVRAGILKHLYDKERGTFIKMIEVSGEQKTRLNTLDMATPYGLFIFGVFNPTEAKLVRTFDEAVSRLSVNGGHGQSGIGRYENDSYYANDSRSNPWFVTTLWYAEYLIARAKRKADFKPVLEIFDWVVRHALPSGVLSEQIRATDSSPCSVAPLTWSHAAYVNTILKYLDRLEELNLCDNCNPTP